MNPDKNTILYIASTMDGYIARNDGRIDWLESIAPAEEGDYGYTELLNSIDTIIMGRKSYEFVIQSGMEWPYSQFNTFVFTRQSDYKLTTPNTCITSDINTISGTNRWLVGGADIIALFLKEQAVDTIIQTITPTLLGNGIRQYLPIEMESHWKLESIQKFSTDLIQIKYSKKKQS